MNDPCAGKCDQFNGTRLARLKAHRSARSNVQTKTKRSRAIELERLVGLGKVEVRTNLYRAIAAISDL